MERDNASENILGDDLNLIEPHFDDERTISSAKPVVPLERVARERNRRGLMLVGAFVIASLLGSVAALALVRVQRSTVSESSASKTAVQPAEQTVAQKPVDTEVTEAEPFQEFFEETEETDPAELPKESPKPRRRTSSNRRATNSPVTITVRPNPESDDPEPRLFDSWMERRQRRVNRRSDNHHRSDLFRIREIFEGPRRARRDQP